MSVFATLARIFSNSVVATIPWLVVDDDALSWSFARADRDPIGAALLAGRLLRSGDGGEVARLTATRVVRALGADDATIAAIASEAMIVAHDIAQRLSYWAQCDTTVEAVFSRAWGVRMTPKPTRFALAHEVPNGLSIAQGRDDVESLMVVLSMLAETNAFAAERVTSTRAIVDYLDRVARALRLVLDTTIDRAERRSWLDRIATVDAGASWWLRLYAPPPVATFDA